MENNQLVEKEKKKIRKVIPILLLFLGLVIIGTGVFLMMKTKTSSNENISNEIKESTFIYNYGVYDFLISNPYQASANEKYGLIITLNLNILFYKNKVNIEYLIIIPSLYNFLKKLTENTPISDSFLKISIYFHSIF